MCDGVVKTLHLLRHCKFTVTAAYLSTPHSIKFEFLEYEVLHPKKGYKYLAILNYIFYEFVIIMNYIDHLPTSAKYDEILKTDNTLQKWVNQDKKGFLRYRTPCEALQQFPASNINCNDDWVQIGNADEVTREEQQKIESHLRQFIPWRKGPFSVYGIPVDSEWQSQRKWQRLADF